MSEADRERFGADQRAVGKTSHVGELAIPDGRNTSPEGLQRSGEHGQQPQDGRASFWSACDWLPCRDGKARPVESATERLADGLSDLLGRVRLESYPDSPHEERFIYAPLIQKGKARVGRLRGYGNAIVAPLAAEFIKTYLTR